MTTANQVMHGAQVMTSDGERLGEVVEIRGDAFRIDIAMMPDYWLPASCVTSADPTTVRLECPKSEVDEHKIEAPDGAM